MSDKICSSCGEIKDPERLGVPTCCQSAMLEYAQFLKAKAARFEKIAADAIEHAQKGVRLMENGLSQINTLKAENEDLKRQILGETPIQPSDPDAPDIYAPIDDLELSVRVGNVLRHLGIESIYEIYNPPVPPDNGYYQRNPGHWEQRLLAIRYAERKNMGKKSLIELNDKLVSHGYAPLSGIKLFIKAKAKGGK